MPINTLAARHARYRPDHTAVVFEGDRYTHREFNERTATPHTLSSILDRLEQRGLVARNPDPADARSVLVSVTEGGHRLVDSLFPILNRKVITGAQNRAG